MTGKIILYEHMNFGGATRELTENVPHLVSIGFSDRVSSIKVFGSVWVAYEHHDYKGWQYILEEGEYPNPKSWKGSNDQITSVAKLRIDIGELPQITLFQDAYLRGRSVNFTHDISNLSYYGFNDEVSSLVVKSGNWVLFEHWDYEGRQFVVHEGLYPHWDSWRGPSDYISSLRPVKEPQFPTEVLSMRFDIVAGLLNATPVALVNLSQRNNGSVDQTASWSTTRTFSTTKTYEWHWDNALEISVETTFQTGVPFIAGGKISMGVTNTYSVGESNSEENTQSDEWHVNLPSVVKAKTMLHVQVNIQQGKIEVPFTAVLKKGNKRWEERGIYKGTQSFNLHVDYNETPL